MSSRPNRVTASFLKNTMLKKLSCAVKSFLKLAITGETRNRGDVTEFYLEAVLSFDRKTRQ